MKNKKNNWQTWKVKYFTYLYHHWQVEWIIWGVFVSAMLGSLVFMAYGGNELIGVFCFSSTFLCLIFCKFTPESQRKNEQNFVPVVLVDEAMRYAYWHRSVRKVLIDLIEKYDITAESSPEVLYLLLDILNQCKKYMAIQRKIWDNKSRINLYRDGIAKMEAEALPYKQLFGLVEAEDE